MDITISVNIENARKVLQTSCGSVSEMYLIQDMTDEEIVEKVIKHIRCWGIERKED